MPCGAVSAVTIAHSDDPRAAERADAWEAWAQRVLLHATCPRCRARNPIGLAAQAKDHRRGRILASGAFLLGGVAAYWLPWLAWVFVGVHALITPLNTLLWLRKDPAERELLSLVASFASLAVMVAFAIFAPRFIGVLGIIAVVRGLFDRPNVDRLWTLAAEKIRFDPVA